MIRGSRLEGQFEVEQNPDPSRSSFKIEIHFRLPGCEEGLLLHQGSVLDRIITKGVPRE